MLERLGVYPFCMSKDDLLARIRDQMQSRLAELEPMVAEYDTLKRARQSLTELLSDDQAVTSPSPSPLSPRPERRRRAGATPSPASGSRVGKRQATYMPRAQRMEQLTALLRDEPDVISSDVAVRMSVSQGYAKQLLAAARAQLREEQQSRA